MSKPVPAPRYVGLQGSKGRTVPKAEETKQEAQVLPQSSPKHTEEVLAKLLRVDVSLQELKTEIAYLSTKISELGGKKK